MDRAVGLLKDLITDHRSRVSLLFAFAAGNGAGYLPMLILPWAIAGLITEAGFSTTRAGWLTSSEIAAMAVTSISAARWINQRSVRRWASGGVTVGILANTLSIWAIGSFGAFLGLRVVAGAGFGVGVAAGTAVASGLPNPARAFAGLWFLTALWQIFVFSVAPRALEAGGLAGLYWFVSIAAGALYPVVLLLGARDVRTAPSSQRGRRSHRRSFADALVLFASFSFWLRDSVTYSMLARMAAIRGVDDQSLGTILAAASGIALAGPVIAGVGGNRFKVPVFAIYAVTAAAVVTIVLVFSSSRGTFSLACLMAPAVTFCGAAALSAVAANIDESGRLAAMGMGVSFATQAIAPVSAGSLIDHAGYTGFAVAVTGIAVLTVAVVVGIAGLGQLSRNGQTSAT